MRSAYPLLVDQNGWSAGICRIPNTSSSSTTTTSLLRSVGVDITRPAQLHHQAHHDIEIHVEDPPSTFSHEYPQPLPVAATHGTIERGKGAGGADHRSKRKLPNSDGSTRANTFNRAVQRLELSIRPDGELCFDTRGPLPLSATPSRGSGASAGTPRASPRSSSSPRAAYNRQHESVHSGVAPAIDPSDGGVPQLNHNQAQRTRGSNGTGSCGGMGPAAPPSFTLPMMSRPSQLSLCCSSPDYYYNEERLRQEPEPGLLKCCDTKISCCPCSPCCEPYCPVGHMNTVCMSMICSGIIMFIVLSPLLHYLVPT
ncbi:uncharacterized protein LOC135202561 [Macrobrachium nipponense]|uniref:uncharacterized protein LOC135202561 n=1 Tax=Macrobrachium nipponense TaxID=159736 RepID=UPI0030C7B07F